MKLNTGFRWVIRGCTCFTFRGGGIVPGGGGGADGSCTTQIRHVPMPSPWLRRVMSDSGRTSVGLQSDMGRTWVGDVFDFQQCGARGVKREAWSRCKCTEMQAVVRRGGETLHRGSRWCGGWSAGRGGGVGNVKDFLIVSCAMFFRSVIVPPLRHVPAIRGRACRSARRDRR